MSARASSSALSATRTLANPKRAFTSSFPTSEPYYNPWRYLRRHTKADPTIPAPLPRLYPQRIVLSDGSTFTSYTTAPSPYIARLTRDVTNNPLWAPGTEKRGLEDQEGRVGRFRRKFEAMDLGGEEGSGAMLGPDEGQVVDDLSWMSEGGREEKAPPPKIKKAAPTKGGKKK